MCKEKDNSEGFTQTDCRFMAKILASSMGKQSRLLPAEVVQRVILLTIQFKFMLFIQPVVAFFYFRSERSDFKREPCKVVSLSDGWTVELTDNSSQTNTFQLINASMGTVYKFRCSSHDLTIAWLKALQKVTRPYVEKLPTNLMTFE